MRVVILSKALVVGAYQRKLEEIANLGVELTVLVPPGWREPRVGMIALERRYTAGYRLEVLPIAFNGQHHLHFYPTLAHVLRRVRPNVFHIDEESFNLATFHAMRLGVKLGARCCFYNYANIDRRYPPPFSHFEHYNFRHAAHALACNREAAAIIERHGYNGPISVVPQFGVDPELFAPPLDPARREGVIVGYLGRFVPEKGILDLLEAVAALPEYVRLRLIGSGTQRPAIEQRAVALGIGSRLEILPAVGSTEVPAALAGLDMLVLPSRTTANWKEQFGRVIIEAMSCGVPVIGSNSGEIPHVIGDAGLIFPEADIGALRRRITMLAEQPALRAEYARRGRAHVLAQYTQAAVARRHVEIYREMAGINV
ncbi:MAG: glycosyltransferase family 4 protein [Oscillochloris sp.]|nr:glycosyltransferase family 4 protein [Oscillochloris sp.]